MVLCPRCPRSHPLLLPFSPLPSVFLALRQYPGVLRWSRCYPPWFRDQLHLVGPRWVYLQLLRASLALPMVDALQLHFIRCPRRWRRDQHDRGVLHCSLPKGWLRNRLVG
jgi:hypothetical protein